MMFPFPQPDSGCGKALSQAPPGHLPSDVIQIIASAIVLSHFGVTLGCQPQPGTANGGIVQCFYLV